MMWMTPPQVLTSIWTEAETAASSFHPSHRFNGHPGARRGDLPRVSGLGPTDAFASGRRLGMRSNLAVSGSGSGHMNERGVQAFLKLHTKGGRVAFPSSCGRLSTAISSV